MSEKDFEHITKLGGTPCPVCDADLNAASPVEGEARPNPGDYSMCYYCGEYLRFTDELQLRALTTKDIEEAPLNELSHMRRFLTKPKKH